MTVRRLVLLALTVGALVAPAAVAAAPAARTAGSPGWAGCRAFFRHAPLLLHRPASVMVACADGNFYLGRLHWTSWGATTAAATGTAHANDCNPYCAAGHFHTYPVAATLDRVQTCGGRSEFTRLRWRFTGARPKGPRTGSQTFRCA